MFVPDTFYIRSGTGRNTPTICGTNIVSIFFLILCVMSTTLNMFPDVIIIISCTLFQGQHMIVDSDGVNCAEVNFNIGGATATRSWDIQV